MINYLSQVRCGV